MTDPPFEEGYQMIRSPFPDVHSPDIPLTEFVLARAGELGDKPALIDAPTGRTITYAQPVHAYGACARVRGAEEESCLTM
ncbi:MAG TPA: hypothetical protein VFI54_14295 [Solirubrobacteraceae bacterium]|nr:hypothetical protein [Solirubrobacteraceae bacterium]